MDTQTHQHNHEHHAHQHQPESQQEQVIKVSETAEEIKLTDDEETEETQTEQPEADLAYNEVKFTFRIPKELKGKEGATKRADVRLKLPYLTATGLINALNTAIQNDDDKVLQHIVTLVNEDIREAASEQVNATENPVNKQEDLDETKLTLEYLANMVRESRKAGIPEELWKDFKTNYMEIMPTLTGKDKTKVERAVNLFMAKLQPAKNSKPVLQVLQPQLTAWYTHLAGDEEAGIAPADAEAAKEFEPIYAYLAKKLDEYLKVSDEEMLKSLV